MIRDAKKKQGQSVQTMDKERQLAAIFCMNLNIVRYACPSEIYTHIDLNSGSGWNDEFDVPGSPIAFITVAESMLDKWQAYFFEWNPAAAAQLREAIGHHPRCQVIEADNAMFLEFARKRLKTRSIGSILCDPNGYLYRTRTNGKAPIGSGAPVAELVEFFKEYRRMDLIANINMRTYDLQKKAREKGVVGPDSYSGFYRLQEFLEVFSKRDGLITKGASNGHSTFVRIVLRNLPTDGYRKWGWYRWQSPEARRIFEYYDGDRKAAAKLQMSLL